MWASIVTVQNDTNAGCYVFPAIVSIALNKKVAIKRAVQFILNESVRCSILDQGELDEIVNNWLSISEEVTVFRYTDEYKGDGIFVGIYYDDDEMMVIRSSNVDLQDIIMTVPASVYLPRRNTNLITIDAIEFTLNDISKELIEKHKRCEYPLELGD